MAETFYDWTLRTEYDYAYFGNANDYGQAVYEAGQASRDDEIREKDARIQELESEKAARDNDSDTIEVLSALWDEKHEQIKWQRARIAKLEKVAEAAKPFATRLCHPEDWKRLADALKELEGK